MASNNRQGILLAVLAAALYAIHSPFSKLLLGAWLSSGDTPLREVFMRRKNAD